MLSLVSVVVVQQQTQFLILNALIQKVLNGKERLYCCFIDLKPALDSVYLNGLFLKLNKSGIYIYIYIYLYCLHDLEIYIHMLQIKRTTMKRK